MRNDVISLSGEPFLWESRAASAPRVSRKEVELIRQWQSNNPEVGYNRWPKFVPTKNNQLDKRGRQ
jgi:hypothetical protein